MLPSIEARFASAHAGDAEREAAARALWRKDMDRVQIQMQAMVESIGLLEREVLRTSEKLLQAQQDAEAEGPSGRAASTAASLELLLGQLEDKLMCTEAELEASRREWYFPTPDGYQLRFSYQDNFLGFKELLVEQLRGTVRLVIKPGIAADGAEQPPAVRLVWDGTGEGIGKEPGGLLRFLGEGLSLFSRREMLGVALSPNITLERMDVSARFVADMPLIYNASRRAWRLEEAFKIELLHFRTEASQGQDATGAAVQESMVRTVMQMIVEAVARQLLLSALGPTLGDYLRTARHGAELVLEVDVRGIPVRTLHAPLADGAAAASDDARGAAALLGLSPPQARQLVEVGARLPGEEMRFGTLAGLLRYFGSSRFCPPPAAAAAAARSSAADAADAAGRRAALCALWQEALGALPSASAAGDAPAVAPAQVGELLERVRRLTRRPATVVLRCRALKLGVEPRRVVRAAHDAVAADLASRGHMYGSANSLLDAVRETALQLIGDVERNLRQASAALRLTLRGGGDADGALALAARHLFYRGQLHLSRLLSARDAPAPYTVTQSIGRGAARPKGAARRRARATAARAPPRRATRQGRAGAVGSRALVCRRGAHGVRARGCGAAARAPRRARPARSPWRRRRRLSPTAAPFAAQATARCRCSCGSTRRTGSRRASRRCSRLRWSTPRRRCWWGRTRRCACSCARCRRTSRRRRRPRSRRCRRTSADPPGTARPAAAAPAPPPRRRIIPRRAARATARQRRTRARRAARRRARRASRWRSTKTSGAEGHRTRAHPPPRAPPPRRRPRGARPPPRAPQAADDVPRLFGRRPAAARRGGVVGRGGEGLVPPAGAGGAPRGRRPHGELAVGERVADRPRGRRPERGRLAVCTELGDRLARQPQPAHHGAPAALGAHVRAAACGGARRRGVPGAAGRRRRLGRGHGRGRRGGRRGGGAGRARLGGGVAPGWHGRGRVRAAERGRGDGDGGADAARRPSARRAARHIGRPPPTPRPRGGRRRSPRPAWPSSPAPRRASRCVPPLPAQVVLRGESPLGMQPWMQPLQVALERARRQLLSRDLRTEVALTLRADTETEGGLTAHLAGPTSLFGEGEGEPPPAYCFTFRNEINLLDFVEDVADLVSALTTKLAAQTPYVSIEAPPG